MKRYKEIERRLTSAQDSTNKVLSFRKETWVFSGLNSPFVSHQSCEIQQGHFIPGLILVNPGEAHRCLMIARDDKILSQVEGKVLAVKLPSFHLQRVFQFPATAPEWVANAGNVVVFYPDLFSGYDDDGAAEFKNSAEISVNGREICSTEKPWRRMSVGI